MTDKPENPPAFPTEWAPDLFPGEAMQTGERTAQYPGMTLLDYFAGQALAGLLAHASGASPFAAPGTAWTLAEAMLAEREKRA